MHCWPAVCSRCGRHSNFEGAGAYQRYELKIVDGRPMVVRNELDRMFDPALRDLCGCEIEPDKKDRSCLD